MHHALDHPKRRPSKLRNRDGDTDVNRCGGWSREKLERMDARFVAAMQRALLATHCAGFATSNNRVPSRKPVAGYLPGATAARHAEAGAS